MPISNLKFQIGLGALLLLVSLFIVSQGADLLAIRFLLLLIVLLKHGLYALGWLAAGLGYGWGVGWALRRWVSLHWSTRTAIGVGLLMLLDWLLGWAGWLNAATAWTACAIGWALLITALLRAAMRDRAIIVESAFYRSAAPVALLAVPAVGLLIGAACIAPGILWNPTEFGGYDALEYHLQLPVQWAKLGAIRGLEHNAYSYLPSLFEAAYMHLHVWSGQRLEWAHAAQLLHAAMAIIAALGIARIVQITTHSSTAAGFSAAAYLATPWTVVTGSMAYNEQAMMALGAAAVALSLEDQNSRFQPLLTGLLCGLATLVKLTAGAMIAAPVALILLLGHRRWSLVAMFGAGTSLAVAPLLIRNVLWTGNPLFPMFADWLGSAHWTGEQAMRWRVGHSPDGSPLGVLAMLFSTSRGLLHMQFGFLLLPLSAAAAVVTLRHRTLRWITAAMLWMLLVQVLFWAAMTHNQSRFLVPALVPICVLLGAGVAAWPRPRQASLLAAMLVLVLTGFSLRLYFRQADGYAAQLVGGTGLMAREAHPYRTLNRLPPDSQIYSEGFATPFYVLREIDYHTVWDRSPLGQPLSSGGPPAAAAWLVHQGYTHVVIDWNMLALWMSPGNYGYDPALRWRELEELAGEFLEPVPDQPIAPSTVPLLVYRVKPH